MKICTACKISKTFDDFHVASHQPDGRNLNCKECRLAKRKIYYHTRKEVVERVRAKSRASTRGRAGMIFRHTKSRALKLGYDFDLTIDFIAAALQKGACQATGLPFDLKASDTFHNPFAPSVDRKDNSKGYTLDNVQIVCTIYNIGKGEHEEEIFEQMCVAVAEKVAARKRKALLW